MVLRHKKDPVGEVEERFVSCEVYCGETGGKKNCDPKATRFGS
jgi:hypothetical protein